MNWIADKIEKIKLKAKKIFKKQPTSQEQADWKNCQVCQRLNNITDLINNLYKNSKGYEYIKRPVDPSYWIHQFNKLMELSPDTRWIVVNHEKWKMPDQWKEHKNVYQETYEGMAKFINKQLTKSK